MSASELLHAQQETLHCPGAALSDHYPFSLVRESKGGHTWSRQFQVNAGAPRWSRRAGCLWVRAVMIPACGQVPSVLALSFLSASVWVQGLWLSCSQWQNRSAPC